MSPTTTARHESTADNARVFLELTKLLNEVEVRHPELSAPLRLTLLRAHRDAGVSWLDQSRFRAVVDELVGHLQAVPA